MKICNNRRSHRRDTIRFWISLSQWARAGAARDLPEGGANYKNGGSWSGEGVVGVLRKKNTNFIRGGCLTISYILSTEKVTLFTAISRKVVGKKAYTTIPKGVVGSFKITVP